jgi:hypothetical protein
VQSLLVSFAQAPLVMQDPIVAAMRLFADNADVQRHACRALANLANKGLCWPPRRTADAVGGAGENKLLLVREPWLVHDLVLAAMKRFATHTDVQRRGCSVLSALSGKSENTTLLLSAPRLAHEAVLQAMQRFPGNSALQRSGCIALTNWTGTGRARGFLLPLWAVR